MPGLGIDVENLTQLSRENLKNLLKRIPGDKDMVFAESLMKPLDRIAGMSVLKSLGVKKVFKLEKTKPATSGSVRVYVILPDLVSTKYVIDHLASERDSGAPKVDVHIVFIPKCLHQVTQLLEEDGIAGLVTIHQFMWEPIPLDYDLLSLELPTFFQQLYVKGDMSWLSVVTRTIWGIQSLFGDVGQTVAVGENAVNVLKQLDIMDETYKNAAPTHSEFSHLFVFDRDTDYVSTMLSPLTYESLLDEVFSINCGSVELDERVTKQEQMNVRLQLSSSDKMFEKIRNKHFSSIFTFLGVHAKQLKQQQAKASAMSVAEMKNFVQNDLKDLQIQSKAIALHIGASEVIQQEKGPVYEHLLPFEHAAVTNVDSKYCINSIEEGIAQVNKIEDAIKMIGLYSHCCGGFSATDYTNIKQQFLQCYGFKHLSTLASLEFMGLFNQKDPRSRMDRSFQTMLKRLRLGPKSDTKGFDTSDPSYVFNGSYTPVAVKVVTDAVQSPAGLEDTLKATGTKFMIRNKARSAAGRDKPKIALVFFLGGYTLAEVAAFRLLQSILGYQFIIAGTSNINGKLVARSTISV